MIQYVYALNLQTGAEQKFTVPQWSDIKQNGLSSKYQFIKAEYEEVPKPDAPKKEQAKPKKKCCGR